MMHLDNTSSTSEIGADAVWLAAIIADQLALAIDNARSVEDMRTRLQETETLLDVGRTISSTLELEELTRRISQEAARLMNADTAYICLLDETKIPRLVEYAGLATANGRRPSSEDVCFLTLLDALGGPEALSGCFSSAAVPDDPRFRRAGLFGALEVQSILVVPLRHRDEALGVMVCLWDKARRLVTRQEERLMLAVAQQASIAITNARLHAHVEELAIRRERMRMAEELHDKASQILFSVGLKLDWCLHRLGAEHGEVIGRLREVKRNSACMMAELRNLIQAWSVETPSSPSLSRRLENLVGQFEELSGLAVETRIEGDLSAVPGGIDEVIYKVLQEALANIAKHARASMAGLTLVVADGRVSFLIRDDGRGSDEDRLHAAETDGNHVGLRLMRSRIRDVGGFMHVCRNKPTGLSISGEIPLPRDGAP